MVKDRRSTLKKANLSGSGLYAANLENADLRGANLKWVYLEKANLKNAKLDKAVWPNGKRCRVGSIGKCITSSVRKLLRRRYCRKNNN